MKTLPPWMVANITFPLHEKLLQRPTFDYLTHLEQTQWLSREAIEALQLEKLKTLLKIAINHCPWHAEHIRAANIDLTNQNQLTYNDLRRLPIMDKNDAINNAKHLMWQSVPGGAHRSNTGGSSGQPLSFYYGRWRQASDAAGRIRARHWYGINVGDPEVYLWGAPVELNKTDKIKTIRDRMMNQLVLNAFEMSPANMNQYIEAIQTYHPKCIYGYASSIALLAAHIRARSKKIKTPHLKVICTTGEPLYPDQRQLIEEVFAVPTANEFGSRDIGFTAHETPQGQILLMSESIILEVLDNQGQTVAPGELGEAVLTGLCSDAQPFIRYRTGDIVRLSNESCKEGRGLHVIDEVIGRTTDFVVRADGTIMHALAIIYIMRAIEGINEFKFVQQTINVIEISLVTNPFWNDDCKNQITKGIKQRLGNEVAITIRLVDKIPIEKSGKHRYIVSHVALPNGLNFTDTA